MTTDQKVKRVIQLDKEMKYLKTMRGAIGRYLKGYPEDDRIIYDNMGKRITAIEKQMAELLPED